MAGGDRRELVQRLLAERRAKAHAASSSPSSSDSRAERYHRIQRLLGERRAKLELEECEEDSQGGLLSPSSTAGFASDRHLEPAQSESWGGSWTPLESTPGGPCMEYSLDDPGHTIARQQSGTLSRYIEHVDSLQTGVRASYSTDGPHKGGRPGNAVRALAGALLSPTSTVSEEMPAMQGSSACRELEWEARASPYRSDSASSTQPRSSRASRAGLGEQNSFGATAAPSLEQQALYMEENLAASKHAQRARQLSSSRAAASRAENLSTTADGPAQSLECLREHNAPEVLPDQGKPYLSADRHAPALISAQQALNLDKDPAADEHAQHGMIRAHQFAKETPSVMSEEADIPAVIEGQMPEEGRTLKQKLFDALRSAPEGPIELDPAMLYSPASSMQPPSSVSVASRRKQAQQCSAARGTPLERRSATVPREFRLSSAHPNNSRAALAERILAERRTEASFMPRTNARSSDQGSRLSDAATLEGDARIARLAQPRTQLWNKCAQKKEQEQYGALAECSFAPVTGRGPKSGSRAVAAKLPAPTRLYANHSSKYKQWDWLRAEQEKEELHHCTFAPKVNESRKGSEAHAPLHRRLEELHRQRRERLARVQVASQPPDGTETFSPVVNEKSMRMALSKQIRELHDEVPAYQRLAALRRQAPKCDSGINEDLTFAPVINASSERMLEDSAQLPGRFLQRQRFFYDLKQQRMRILQAEDGPECTFSPKTEEHSKAILAASSNAGWLEQCSADQSVRLAVADKERVEGSRAAASHAYYSQFTFQPAINPRSKQLIRGDRLAELSSDDARRAKLEAAAAQLEMERDRECTFKPALSSGTMRLSNQENQDPDAASLKTRAKQLEEARERKQADLEQQRSARENEELAECSFAPPKARKPPLAPKEAVKVRGMEQYMRNKQHARNLDKEQRAREQKAFLLEVKGRLNPCTIPEPFALKTELRELETANRRAQLQAKILAASMKECTFQPKTNETLNRELLRAIMQDDDDDPPESIASASTV